MSTTKRTTTNTTTLHPCCLDLNSPKSRRKAQKAVSQRLARQRMMQTNANELAEDGTNVVYRTGIQHGDYSSDFLSSYTQVEFLNNHDIVLAGSQAGSVDIVRLARYHPPDDEETPRPLGTLIASQASTGIVEPVHCLKSLDQGKSFVVGQREGKFTICATEHGSSFIADDCETRRVVQQRLESGNHGLDLRGKTWTCHTHEASGDDYAHFTHSVECMLTSWGLRRKGIIDFIQHYPGRPSPLAVNPRCEYAWDFRESPSTLMASFLEREVNSFSISIVDARTSLHISNSVSCVGDEASNKFDSQVGLVASSCFVSDHIVATLHMWQQPSCQKSMTTVKLWDIRMHTGKQKSVPVVERVLSPSIHDRDGSVVSDSIVTLDSQVEWEKSPAQARLTPSIDDNGRLMANIVANNDRTESYLLDGSSASVIRKVLTRSTVHSTNAVTPMLDCLACYDSSSLSLYDLAKDNKKKRTGGSPRGTKRSLDALDERKEEFDDNHLIRTIVPTIEDEIGIRSRLNCLAFNRSGTSLVAGTDAGDIFLWRGG